MTLATPKSHHLTFAREVTARGLFGTVLQRGLQIAADFTAQTPVAVFRAYTAEGLSQRARLEVPVEDLRRLARDLLELADDVDRARGRHLRLAPVSLADLARETAAETEPLRRVG